MLLLQTVSFETGIQNTGLSIMIVQAAMRSPDSDLALIPVITVAIMTCVPWYIVSPIYMIWQKWLKKVSLYQTLLSIIPVTRGLSRTDPAGSKPR